MNSYSSASNNDLPIMATADDAITAKQAAVDTGYYDDPFLQSFASSFGTGGNGGGNGNSTNSNPISRPRVVRRRQIQPIIKRGTHARVCVMDKAISGFLKLQQQQSSSSTSSSCQIVVLGAGKDTSYFRYCTKSIMGQEEQSLSSSEDETVNVKWYEVDHSIVIQEKAKIIQQSSTILNSEEEGQLFRDGAGGSLSLQQTQYGYQLHHHSSTSSSTLTLIGHDLRSNPNELLNKLNLNDNIPTLILIECVFMYMPSIDTRRLLQTLASSSNSNEHLYVVAYEPILKHDPFGKMMENNLHKVGVITSSNPNTSLVVDRTLDDQLKKYIESNFDIVVGCDMWSAYETIVTQKQRLRANQSEFLDEIEEWILIMQHYCYIVAQRRRKKQKQQGGDGDGDGDGDDNDDDNNNNDLTAIGPNSPIGFISGKCEMKKKKV